LLAAFWRAERYEYPLAIKPSALNSSNCNEDSFKEQNNFSKARITKKREKLTIT